MRAFLLLYLEHPLHTLTHKKTQYSLVVTEHISDTTVMIARQKGTGTLELVF